MPANGLRRHASTATLDTRPHTRACFALVNARQVIDASGGVSWDDIAGLSTAKHLIKEIVVWPMLNPHLFTVSMGIPRPIHVTGLTASNTPGAGKGRLPLAGLVAGIWQGCWVPTKQGCDGWI